MAYDKTQPRNNVILGVGIFGAVSLIALIPVFHSYFDWMMGREFAAKVEQVPNTELQRYREQQQSRLTGTQVSVSQAMDTLELGGRPLSEQIIPRRNGEAADVDAIEGWVLLKNEQGAHAARAAWDRVQAARAARDASAVDGGVAPTEDAPAAPVAPAPAAPEQPVTP